MTYCRICGRELAFRRTANDKWMPCDALTGEPHFCGGDEAEKSGLRHCDKCGRPYFVTSSDGKAAMIDYETLEPHECKKRCVTNYTKYKTKHPELKKTEKIATQKKNKTAAEAKKASEKKTRRDAQKKKSMSLKAKPLRSGAAKS